MAILCPHCGEAEDGGAQVRAFGQRWHQRCWVPWLRAALPEPDRKERMSIRPIADAPRDGTPVLVKIKNDLSPWGIKPGDFGNTASFAGLKAVMRNRGDIMGWCFAAPVGRGGFADEWLDGWWPLPVE